MKSLAEVLQTVIDARLNGVHVHLPGRVVSYDEGTQRAQIRLGVRVAVPDAEDDDLDVLEDLPVLQDVKVMHPQAGGFFVHLPVTPGDGVLVEFVDRDPSEWEETGEVSDPVDRRLHSLGYPVALLGYGPRNQAISSPGSGLALGSTSGHRVRITDSRTEVGGDSDAAALASRLDALIKVLKSWAIPGPDGGAALKTAVIAAFPSIATGLPAPQTGTTTGSAQLKIGG